MPKKEKSVPLCLFSMNDEKSGTGEGGAAGQGHDNERREWGGEGEREAAKSSCSNICLSYSSTPPLPPEESVIPRDDSVSPPIHALHFDIADEIRPSRPRVNFRQIPFATHVLVLNRHGKQILSRQKANREDVNMLGNQTHFSAREPVSLRRCPWHTTGAPMQEDTVGYDKETSK